MAKIFIDPGHGGNDPGAVGQGLMEKHINLEIAKKLDSILKSEYSGVTTRLSRTGDQTVSLSERTNVANSWGADYYVSIHVNAGGGTGFESYIYNGNVSPTTVSRQRTMHQEIMRQIDMRNRGMKRANFHVLRATRMPAILTENGFIDTRADVNKLTNQTYLDRIARGHANGLASIFNLKKRSTASPSPSESSSSPNADQVLYKVQAGAFVSRENAERLVNELKKHGFSAFIIETKT